jgi:uncharacterized protein with PIN domain
VNEPDETRPSENHQPRFACDAMLGGLARWLRAAGYCASFHEGIEDRALVDLARAEGRVLLSCDTDFIEYRVIRDGIVPSLFVPLRVSPERQLAHVLEQMNLPLRDPRCMACGGNLDEVSKERVRDRVPPRTFAWLEQFWECAECQQVFWKGSHWQGIEERLRQASEKEPPRSSA